MTNTIKILIAIVITALLTFFVTREITVHYETTGIKSDTTKISTTKNVISTNSFSAEQIGNIKRHLIDSLNAVYKAKIKKNMAVENILSTAGPDKDSNASGYVFVSEIDTNFVVKDSTGKMTDSTNIKSTFFSPIPLAATSMHFLSMVHKSYNKVTETIMTVTDTKTIEKKISFFDRFKVVPNISAGYGLTARIFDIYAGIGITFEF